MRLCWDDERCTNLGETRADLTGHISTDITVPNDADGGGHSIHACQRGLGWSCDSVGFEVIVPTTTTTQPPTTTTTSPPATTSPTADGGEAPPGTGAPETGAAENSSASGTTSSSAADSTSTTAQLEKTTTTTTDGFGIFPSYQPPDDGPGSPGTDDPEASQATASVDGEEGQAAPRGANKWVVALCAVTVAGVTLWGPTT